MTELSKPEQSITSGSELRASPRARNIRIDCHFFRFAIEKPTIETMTSVATGVCSCAGLLVLCRMPVRAVEANHLAMGPLDEGALDAKAGGD